MWSFKKYLTHDSCVDLCANLFSALGTTQMYKQLDSDCHTNYSCAHLKTLARYSYGKCCMDIIINNNYINVYIQNLVSRFRTTHLNLCKGFGCEQSGYDKKTRSFFRLLMPASPHNPHYNGRGSPQRGQAVSLIHLHYTLHVVKTRIWYPVRVKHLPHQEWKTSFA